MVNFCAVIGCGKRGDREGTSFYRLPSIISHQGEQKRELSERRRRKWLAAIWRQDIKPENYPYTCVCSDHLIGGKPSTLYVTTHPDWIPSRHLGHSERKEAEGERYARAAERAAKKIQTEQECESTVDDSLSGMESGTAVQTTLVMYEIASMEDRLPTSTITP